MRRRIPFAFAALALLVAMTASACGSDEKKGVASTTTAAQPSGNKTVTKTIKVAFDGSVDDPNNRLFAVTYFYSDELGPKELGDALTRMFGEGKDAPESVVMGIAGVCGPAGYGDKMASATGFRADPVTTKPCANDGAPYSVDLDLPAGTTLHYSVDTGLVSDLDNTETFAGNYVGDPNDPPTAEDFEVVKADNTTSYTYHFGAKG